MSTASKVVLSVSVVLSIGAVGTVHFKQNWDRQVTEHRRPKPSNTGLMAERNTSP